jgi:HlyD family secretion protein
LIAPGQKAHLEVDAFRDRKFTGEVTEIANTARTTGMGSQQEATKFEVKILVAEKENFRPGMSVTAEIETRRRTNVVTVPIQSVTTRLLKKEGSAKPASSADASSRKSEETMPRGKGGKGAESAEKPAEVVFVVAEGQVKAVPVERGISDDEYVEIVSGLSEGQEVVSGGYNAIMRELEDGKRVEVTRPDNQSKDQTSPLKKP